jgi:hypothetical protein
MRGPRDQAGRRLLRWLLAGLVGLSLVASTSTPDAFAQQPTGLESRPVGLHAVVPAALVAAPTQHLASAPADHPRSTDAISAATDPTSQLGRPTLLSAPRVHPSARRDGDARGQRAPPVEGSA